MASEAYLAKLRDPRWQRKRLEILQRDDWTCQWCTAKDVTLNVHHLRYEGEPWEVHANSLLTLCEDCHTQETNDKPRAEAELLYSLRAFGFTSSNYRTLASLFCCIASLFKTPFTHIHTQGLIWSIGHALRTKSAVKRLYDRRNDWVERELAKIPKGGAE